MADSSKSNKTLTQTPPAVNSPRAWWLAARPKTLTGAAVPVMMGCALAVRESGFGEIRLLPALLCLLFAFLMQIDSNFINDYFDFVHGNDDATRLGPKRACAEGWITLGTMRKGLVLTSALACAVGLPLIFYGGPWLVVVGAACVLFAFLYTTFFSYKGLGDVLVLVFFGLVPVGFTFYVVVPEPHFNLAVLLSGIACGLVIDTLLIVNNYRDRDNDRRAGKFTLVVRIGQHNAEHVYLWLGLIAPALVVTVSCCYPTAPSMPLWEMLVLDAIMLTPYLFWHVSTLKRMRSIGSGRELNTILGLTSRNMFTFGVLSSAIFMLF